jgi:hypothetical protein
MHYEKHNITLGFLCRFAKKCADVPIRKNFKRRNEEEDFF